MQDVSGPAITTQRASSPPYRHVTLQKGVHGGNSAEIFWISRRFENGEIGEAGLVSSDDKGEKKSNVIENRHMQL